MEAKRILERPTSLTWTYDAEADVLYLSLGEPRPAEGIDVGEGLVLRYDPARNEVAGLTVIGLRERLLRGLDESESDGQDSLASGRLGLIGREAQPAAPLPEVAPASGAIVPSPTAPHRDLRLSGPFDRQWETHPLARSHRPVDRQDDLDHPPRRRCAPARRGVRDGVADEVEQRSVQTPRARSDRRRPHRHRYGERRPFVAASEARAAGI